MDWITLTIESIGLIILCIWIVLPIREFGRIFKRVLPKGQNISEPSATVPPLHPRNESAS